MTYHALVVDDDSAILEDVQDRLESLGHTCDCVSCVQSARGRLKTSSYSYILLDLEIPVRAGRPCRAANGLNLLSGLGNMTGHETTPIIVMAADGQYNPEVAIKVVLYHHAMGYVRKPFPERGPTLEKAIRRALPESRRARRGKKEQSGPSKNESPQPFECGEMVFSQHRVELCGVKICNGPESGMIRRILDELRQTNGHGRRARYAGDELARLVDCERGQNGVAEAVRAFRTHVCEVMLAEANIQMDRLHDIILNDRRYGYRLSPKIMVRDAGEPANGPQHPNRDPVNEPQSDAANAWDDARNNQRQQWALEKMLAGAELRKEDMLSQFQCSMSTAERDLRDLRRRGLIEFAGPTKTGYWRPVCPKSRAG